MPEFTISEITSYLYISSFPRREQAEQIRALGVKLILSLYIRKPDKVLGKPPITLLWIPIIDSPITPIPMNVFKQGVQAALPVINDGGKVLVHCKWGVHRSAAMACCVLIGMGYTTEEAIELVKRQRPVAAPDDGYVKTRIRLFEQDWNRRMSRRVAA
jgi:hypothetical protein